MRCFLSFCWLEKASFCFSFIIWDAAIEDFHYIDISGDEILVSLVPEDTYDAFLDISDVNVINQLEHNVRIENARMTSLIIYNVDDSGNITVYTYQEGADKTMYTTDYIASGAGSYTAPDGTIINKTSIYSKVIRMAEPLRMARQVRGVMYGVPPQQVRQPLTVRPRQRLMVRQYT